MIDTVFDPMIGALNTSLNLRLANQNVISSNIANADTPGYKSTVMEFESALRDALACMDEAGEAPMHAQRSHPGHRGHQETDPIDPLVYEDPRGEPSLDGNTVDRAAEMSKLAENQLLYDAAIEMMKKKLAMLKYSISEGGHN